MWRGGGGAVRVCVCTLACSSVLILHCFEHPYNTKLYLHLLLMAVVWHVR